MPIFELVQEMIFVNTCAKFRDDWLRNEVCRAVTPLGHVYVWADPYIPCEGIIKKDSNMVAVIPLSFLKLTANFS